jgi:hypothetical protein
VLYRITDEADENVQGVLGGFAPFADAYGADDDRLGAWLVRKARAGAAAAARTG